MLNTTNTITRLMSVSDASKYLAVSQRTLWNLTRDKRIPAVRIGRAVRYDKNDLDFFIQTAKTGNQPEAIGQILPSVLTDIEQRRTAAQQGGNRVD